MNSAQAFPLVTVITPTTGSPFLSKALDGIAAQSYGAIQHLVVIDGAERAANARVQLSGRPVDVIELPYPTGADRYNGHRIYAAATFLGKGDFFCFLDEDNWPDCEHVESLVGVLKAGNEWAFSLRKVVDKDGNIVCPDNCESLGKWPTILAPKDYLVDVNCFMLPRKLAVLVAPIWYRKAREPGVTEVDRMITEVLRAKTKRFDSNYLYSINYRAGNTLRSVKASCFLNGNAKMATRFRNGFPWDRQKVPQNGSP